VGVHVGRNIGRMSGASEIIQVLANLNSCTSIFILMIPVSVFTHTLIVINARFDHIQLAFSLKYAEYTPSLSISMMAV